ncbi:MAG TPA: ferritin [Alphaproteobacteria bacterium]|nr:ferritin [Alphaproteobacteria bacterium]
MGEMAKKIIKLDLDELLKVLNEAYAEEWLAYYQYWLGAKLAYGPERPSVVKEFEEHAGEELKHADWLANRILQLGGTPALSPEDWGRLARCRYMPPKVTDVQTLVKENLASERCAVERYQRLCEMTEGKDYETFRISRKILKEELEHEQEMEDFEADFKN